MRSDNRKETKIFYTNNNLSPGHFVFRTLSETKCPGKFCFRDEVSRIQNVRTPIIFLGG